MNHNLFAYFSLMTVSSVPFFLLRKSLASKYDHTNTNPQQDLSHSSNRLCWWFNFHGTDQFRYPFSKRGTHHFIAPRGKDRAEAFAVKYGVPMKLVVYEGMDDLDRSIEVAAQRDIVINTKSQPRLTASRHRSATSRIKFTRIAFLSNMDLPLSTNPSSETCLYDHSLLEPMWVTTARVIDAT